MANFKLNSVTVASESGGVVTLDSATIIPALDEDAMGSDSATKVATQQSIKAYVDSGANTNPAVSTYDAYYLVVAGGGCGGGTNVGGGGGAGGFLTNYGGSAITLTVGTTYTCTIGAGGVGTSTQGTNGVNSVLSGSNITDITSIGGGAGGGNSGTNGANGGSGGGSGATQTGTVAGTGVSGQGFAGGAGHDGQTQHTSTGGGGGAGANGHDADQTSANTLGRTQGGQGGEGKVNLITGSSIYYAGGGAGACDLSEGVEYVNGGKGGGGYGYAGAGGTSGWTYRHGQDGLGGGGGGGDQTAPAHYPNGGSGVIILRLEHFSGTTTGSPKITTLGGGVTVLEFTGTGTYTA